MIRIQRYEALAGESIFARVTAEADVSGPVSEILAEVRAHGDEALRRYSARFDGVALDSFRVTEEELEAALAAVEPSFLAVLQRARENITAFHEKQRRTGFLLSREDGVVMGQLVRPLDSVGLYVPGGTAAYPSTVLMDSIPARLAGCRRIVMTTPPRRDGTVAPAILAAASVAGVDEIWKVGGAQAVAALAYGTESIARVDKIVGPGNAYVAEAKKQVFGQVAIDMIAGPSEILIVADAASNPVHLAADLLSQAEHDKLSSAVLVTDSEPLALAVQAELERQLALLERREIAAASIEQNGRIILTDDLQTAMDISNALAPEHLELCVEDPFAWLGAVRNAGSVFLGRNCPEALGDYLAGPNHTLPTGGTARFSSPLSVDDFVKKTQYTYFTPAALDSVAEDVAAFARMEGLTAHARSALIRGEGAQ